MIFRSETSEFCLINISIFALKCRKKSCMSYVLSHIAFWNSLCRIFNFLFNIALPLGDKQAVQFCSETHVLYWGHRPGFQLKLPHHLVILTVQKMGRVEVRRVKELLQFELHVRIQILSFDVVSQGVCVGENSLARSLKADKDRLV